MTCPPVGWSLVAGPLPRAREEARSLSRAPQRRPNPILPHLPHPQYYLNYLSHKSFNAPYLKDEVESQSNEVINEGFVEIHIQIPLYLNY